VLKARGRAVRRKMKGGRRGRKGDFHRYVVKIRITEERNGEEKEPGGYRNCIYLVEGLPKTEGEEVLGGRQKERGECEESGKGLSFHRSQPLAWVKGAGQKIQWKRRENLARKAWRNEKGSQGHERGKTMARRQAS